MGVFLYISNPLEVVARIEVMLPNLVFSVGGVEPENFNRDEFLEIQLWLGSEMKLKRQTMDNEDWEQIRAGRLETRCLNVAAVQDLVKKTPL